MTRVYDNPIFVIGAHKSGSSYLRNLLDGHPDIASIPLEAHYFEHANYWIDYSFRRQKPKAEKDFVESVVKQLEQYLNQSNPYSDFDMSDYEVDLEKYATDLQRRFDSSKNESERAGIYFESLVNLFYPDHETKSQRLCEKSVENAEFAADLKRLFPNAKFLHIVRNPYDQLSSFRRYRQNVEGSYPRIDRMVLSLKNSYQNMYKNQKNIDDYLVVKYEDVRDNTEKKMKEISNFLNLNYDKSLLSPTVAGKSWGTNTTKSSKTTSDIFGTEIFYVNKVLSQVVSDFGYSKKKPSKGFWSKNKKESFKTYWLNRSFRYSL